MSIDEELDAQAIQEEVAMYTLEREKEIFFAAVFDFMHEQQDWGQGQDQDLMNVYCELATEHAVAAMYLAVSR